MQIIIDNTITITGIDKNLKNYLTNLLTIPNPAYENALKHNFSVYNIPKFLYNFTIISPSTISIPRGLRTQLIEVLENSKLKYSIKDNRTMVPNLPKFIYNNVNLRPYQQRHLNSLIEQKAQEGFIIAPPGSGKTVLGITLMSLFAQPVLWLTHMNRLVKQTAVRIHSFMPNIDEEDIGFIGNGKWNIGKYITIGMVQTMMRDMPKVKELKDKFGLVILDEAHHCPAKTFSNVISELNPHYLFGLTALDYRSDGLEKLMFQTIGNPVVTIPLQEIVEAKGIIMPKVIYKQIQSKVMDGNNAAALITYLTTNSSRNNTIVKDILAEAFKGEICIVISGRKAHCEQLYNLIKLSWDKVGIATGDYKEKENDVTIGKLESGEITVIVTTPELLGEGFDVDILSRAFLTLPLRAEGRIEQLLGRIQRYHPNKKDVRVYDYVDVNIGIFKNQFWSKNPNKECRYRVYQRLGLEIVPEES